MPDPGLPGAILFIAGLAIAALVIWSVDRRARDGKRRSGATHSMSRDDALSYFRDQSATSSGPGVQEEDRTERWGKQDGAPQSD